MIRAARNIMRGLLGDTQNGKPMQNENNPNFIRLKRLLDNRNGVVPYICHAKVQEFGFDEIQYPHSFLGDLRHKFHLKGPIWSLERSLTGL
jgi:hypothetical protein